MLMTEISSCLSLPSCSVDATNYSETGFVGEDVVTIPTHLLKSERSKGNALIAETGLCYIDELDKITAY